MAQKFSLSYHGSPFAEQIRQQGFRPGSRLSIAPGKVFSTPNVNFASGYGKPISMVTPRNAFSIPSMNLSTGNIGKEIIQNPGTATRQMGLASKLGTKYTGPTAQRLLAGEAVSGIGASQAGRSVLGRVLGAALGPAAGYASALTAPNMIMASILDGPNVRSGAADQYVGMMGEAMPEEDYAGLADLLGIPEASQALDDEYYNFDELPSTRQTSSPRAAGAEDIKEEGIFSLGDILADLGRKGVEGFKDVAGRTIASKVGTGVGAMIDPYFSLAGGITGLLGGGDLFNAPYIGAGAATVDEFGRMYSAEQLDKLNAAGGYYSDPARSSRRRDARIRNMIERKNAGLKIGLDNLAKLQEQQRREEAARQSAASAMQQSNIESGTGGYQSDFAQDSDFMGGSGTAAEMGSF